MERSERIRIFRENLRLFAEGSYTTTSRDHGTIVRGLAPGIPDYYDSPFTPAAGAPLSGTTRIEVVNDDCIEVARRLSRGGHRVAILNMASLSHPGGGVERGSGAQEEQLCRRSNLLLSLYQFSSGKVAEYPGLGLSLRKEGYPMHPRHGGIYSPDVLFFREDEKHGCALSDDPFTAGVISVAAMNHPPLDGNFEMTPAAKEQTRDKIRTILRIGLEHGHDALVLGAFGCGAFANPPAQVARLFHEVIDGPEFKDRFGTIVFAVLEDRNSLRNSATGNFLPFREEFENRFFCPR